MDFKKTKRRYEKILEELSNPELISDSKKLEKLSREKNYLEKIIEKSKKIKEISDRIEENKEILKSKEDPELLSLAEEELCQLQEKKQILEKELENLRKEKSETQSKKGAVIIEIRQGTGGEEAALFAADLFRMYSKYGQSQEWKTRILESRPTELGGFKEIVFEMKDGDCRKKMKYEAGVHRVQRIPTTEKSGRIHTSTATVAVLARSPEAALEIKPQDIEIDFHRASGPGGQYVNKRATAVRILHKQSGIVVTSQTERNQLRNRENAMAILEAKLSDIKEQKELEKLGKKRRSQIKWAKRAEKIRTYNFPQDRVTDHRIKKSWHNIEGIMAGKLDKIIKTLQEKLK